MNSRKLARLSRDKRFLVKASIFLVGLSLVISAILAVIPKQDGGTDLDDTNWNLGADIGPDLNAKQLADAIRNRALTAQGFPPRDYDGLAIHEPESGSPQNSPDYQLLKKRVWSSTIINEGERERLDLLVEAIHRIGEPRKIAIEKLLNLEDSKRYRNEFLGDAYLAAGEPVLAIESYVREGKHFPGDAKYSQRSALVAYTKREEKEPLGHLLIDRAFRSTLSPSEKAKASIISRSYAILLLAVLEIEFRPLLTPAALFCLLASLIWFVILALFDGFQKRTLIWGASAFAMGIISVLLTLYILYIQKYILNFTHNEQDDFLNQLISMIAGIGLREETAKLLCYMPIACLILRYRSAGLAVVTAGMTGLGFAMFENIQYLYDDFGQLQIFSATGRLLSANALHLCLTGIVGYSFYALLERRGRKWENFLMDFLLVVAIHGVYDALILVPQLQELSIATLIIIVLIGYRYFDLVRHHMNTTGIHSRISPLGILVLGTAAFACLTLILGTHFMGLTASLSQFLMTLGGAIPLAFAYISRLRDI